MSNIDLQSLEAYLFAEDKQDFLKKLIPGTEAHDFFSLLHFITTSQKIDTQIENQAREYHRRYGHDDSKYLLICSLLKKYDDASTTKEEKSKIIKELVKDYLDLTFDHTKPSDIAHSSLEAGQAEPSVLDQDIVSIQSDIEKAYDNLNDFNAINSSAYTLLDTKKIMNGNLEVFHRFLSTATPTDFEDFPDMIIEFIKRKKCNPSPFGSILDGLSIEQLENLAKKSPELNKDSDFVQTLCKKHFGTTSLGELGKNLPKDQKRELMLKFYTWVKTHCTQFPSLASNALYEILQLDLELGKFDKELFVKYLQDPMQRYPNITHNQQVRLESRPQEQRAINFVQQRIRTDEVIRTYLEEFFKDAKDTSPFDEYLDTNYLREIFYSTKLLAGQNLESSSVLSPEKLKQLGESKELTICKQNQEYFKTDDSVTIKVAIKNVPSLMVKVFEFKSENYYLKEKKQLDGTINLDGLIAAEEFNYDFHEPPVKKFIKEFKFDSISAKKQGIFIVDFIGNGISSRAVIRKGRLAVMEYQTVAGQLFYIVDEETNICKGKRTGIWIKDRFYRADENGKILVPFSSKDTVNVVLVHDNLAEFSYIQLKQESFEFKCAYIYNYESFLMGNKAKVLVQPRLFLNQQPIGLDIIQSCSAVVTATNDEGITSRNTFNNLKLSTAEEIELEFPIHAKLKEISIDVKANIVPANKKESQEYTSNHKIDIDIHEDSTTLFNVYLRYTKDGYELFALGKNGEPKPRTVLNCSFQNKYVNNKILKTLQTDQNGKITLGKLQDINQVEVTSQTHRDSEDSIYKSWFVNSQKNVNYPQTVRICEGDKITLPLPRGELSRHKISFVKTLPDGTALSDQLNLLKAENNKLIIPGLQEGSYRLHLKEHQQTVSLTVFKGKYWSQNSSYLFANDTLINVKSDVDNIVITNIKVQPKDKSELADIIIESYVDQPERTRFHVFGAQFLDMDVNAAVKKMNANLPTQTLRDVVLARKENHFLNNRALGDEYSYVLDRKSQPRFIGNTLEKPPILIKKTFVRETDTKEEELKDTQAFKADAMMSDMRYAMDAPVGASLKMAKKKQVSAPRRVDPIGDSFLNFLANSCAIYSNLKPNKEGILVIKDFPYKKYALLHIVASNLSSNISEVFPLENTQIPTKDLTQKARDNQSTFSISRVANTVRKGEKFLVKDLASTEIQTIDSLPKLFNAMKNLVSTAGRSYMLSSFDSWEFLKDWENLSEKEKLEKYDKFASHELNLFVYFKDTPFFEKVVRPFLINKVEKSIVDYFLLDDVKKIQLFAKTERFSRLSSLEQILVIMGTQKINKEQAKNLATSLENMHLSEKEDPQLYNRYFDTILLSKQVEEEQDADEESYRGGYGGGGGGEDYGGGGGMLEECCQVSTAAYGIERAMAPQKMMMRMEMADESEAYLEDYGGKEFIEKRAKIQEGFQELEKTKEYEERQYYEQRNVWIQLNRFWVTFAKHIVSSGSGEPFLTQDFIYAHSCATEMIAAMSLLSLPFKAENHAQRPIEGHSLEIEARSNLVIFTKAVTKAESDLREDVVVRQRFFDDQDKYTESEDEPGVQVEKEVDQFVINRVYGSTVIVTNSSSSRQQVQVLVEIPEGAIPVKSFDYTKSHNLSLKAFSTKTIEYFFYFPHVGKFKVIPPSVSKKGKVLAVGKIADIEVKTEKTYAKLETLEAILNKGSKEDILNFVRTKNIWNRNIFNFNSIYWLLTDKEFFLKFINILRERGCFDSEVWTYGFHHEDVQTIKEYFAHNELEDGVSSSILYFHSSLLEVDQFKVLEYNPFINQRVHSLVDEKNRILNVQLKEQYKRILSYLCQRDRLETQHHLSLIYYLLLQDRVQEAMKFFAKIDREEVRKTQVYELQYDYFSAYLDFYIGSPKFAVAREICQKYLKYPVLSWRRLFVEVANQLAEYDGKPSLEDEVSASEDKNRNLANAEKEETVNMEIQGTQIILTHQNVHEITLSFYRIDLEVLFSRNPFINQSKDEFSFIEPNHTQTIEIKNSKSLEKSVYNIPDDLKKHNLYIELKTDNKTQSATYFSTSLHVQIIENYGQVKVMDKDNKLLPQVYVKCFAKAKKDAKVTFYKDGYTDLRGRFDYATLNSNDISNIEKFAIFVMSDDLGSLTREVKPPNKLGRIQDS